MRLRLPLLLLPALVLGACVPRGSAAADLLEVVARARAADPVLAAAGAQRSAQQEGVVQARAALLPQWQASAVDSRTQADGSRSQQLASSLSQVLFDRSRVRQLDAARSDAASQDARLRAAEQALRARVAQAYFGVLSAQAALATTLANEAAYAAQVGQAQARFASGLSAQVDVEQARAYHALARGSTVQARLDLADAQAALTQLTGAPAEALQPLASTLPALLPEPADADSWVGQALRDNPALAAQALGLDASEQRVQAARAAHWPTLSAGLDTQRSGGPGTPAADRGRSTTQVALRLSVPLFAGGATESQARQAAFQRDAVREDLEAARRQLERETRFQFRAVVSGLALMDSTRAAVAAAERALASTRAGQNLGTRSMTDLLLAIQTQTSALNAHEQARHGYVLARLLLQQAAGRLTEDELATVNRWLDPQAGRPTSR